MKYFGLVQQCGDPSWPSPSYYFTSDTHVLVVKNTLEPYLRDEWKGWEQALTASFAETESGKKDVRTYRRAVQLLDINECPEGIKTIIRDARQLSQR
ncbi:hypothetical protein KIMH_06140 [Bombiscardovia apis]|uniref:Uncharacterized protein n=1 Tax=Bombiscardovia apis TaxID=2932182 RepID=A0ABN6SFS3_9BIFI|nr:hypothetical protein [Bombiscardovia apis]BDR54503.1 hypothetical protein KIMH_06140 [Bombiscardovia apis]